MRAESLKNMEGISRPMPLIMPEEEQKHGSIEGAKKRKQALATNRALRELAGIEIRKF